MKTYSEACSETKERMFNPTCICFPYLYYGLWEPHVTWNKSLVFSNLFTFSSFQIWLQKKKASPKPCLSVLRVVLNTSLCPVCSCVLVFNTSLCALVGFNLVTLNTSLCASRSPFGLSIWILVSAPAGRDTCLPLLLSLSCPPIPPGVAQWSTNVAQCSNVPHWDTKKT